MKSTIRLFKAVPITAKKKEKASKELLKKTIKRGFIFSPEVISNYSEKELIKLIKTITSEIGLNAEELNNAFHKSWKKVKEASIEQLMIEQIMHYITTYGFEKLGCYDKKSVFIPKEKLELPKIDIEGINLVVINGYTKKELKEKLLTLLGSGIALGEDTIIDVIDVIKFVEIKEKEIEDINNKEVKIAIYDHLKIFPENPTEFLRYVIYKATGKTLLIKNKETIEMIKIEESSDVLALFVKYKKKYGLERLAEIFYRFKPLFLAFRTNKQLKSITNKIRKLAKKNHKPMKVDYLNDVTANVSHGLMLTKVKLDEELNKVNTFRKIRLAYALKFRTKDVSSILYKIRNGKGYAKKFSFENKGEAKRILKIVLDSIIKDIEPNVKGKKIYIPKHIKYSLPATEKQFTGNFPSGTCVTIPKDMVFGVHWENVKSHRIDLDLSLINSTVGKIGWDSDYRTEDRNILFSGDVTDAPKPKGASELFYIRRQKKDSFILLVNYFNHEEKVDVPFKIIVAKEQVSNLKNNYMVNPNNVVCLAKTKINQKQQILGLIETTTNECRFYFAETNIGKSITSSGSEFVEHSKKYLFDFYTNTISLNDVLEKAGAKIVKDKKKCDIDLSPERLEKDSIMSLLK